MLQDSYEIKARECAFIEGLNLIHSLRERNFTHIKINENFYDASEGGFNHDKINNSVSSRKIIELCGLLAQYLFDRYSEGQPSSKIEEILAEQFLLMFNC